MACRIFGDAVAAKYLLDIDERMSRFLGVEWINHWTMCVHRKDFSRVRWELKDCALTSLLASSWTSGWEARVKIRKRVSNKL